MSSDRMQFPKELWHLPEGARVIVLWEGSVRDQKEPVYELADIYERLEEETVLIDIEGTTFRPTEYYKDESMLEVRLPTPEEEMAIRLGVIETHVT